MYNWKEANDEYFNQFLRFGKYRNKKISEVLDEDPQYIRWLLQQEWLDNSIRYTIEKEIDKRRQPQREKEQESETQEEQSRNKSKVEKVILEALTSRGWTTSEAEQMIRRMKS